MKKVFNPKRNFYIYVPAFFFLVLNSRGVIANENTEVKFNSSFLRSSVDISAFSRGNPVPEGENSIDVYVNDKWKGKMSVLFRYKDNDKIIAQPCFNSELIALVGFDTSRFDTQSVNKLQRAGSCVRINELAKGIEASYDSGSQQLNISSPQILLFKHSRGYVDPALWDNGVPAAMLKYDYNAWHSSYNTSKQYSSQYLGLTGGINFDAWRLRYRGSYSWSDNSGNRFRSSRAYLERGINSLKSRLVLGSSYTDGQVFDSVSFHGAMIMSEDKMNEDSRRGYAPVITGVANSTARVRVTQKGTLIYETTVSAGPFRIDDLYPMGSGGDLLVTIKEADGSERRFTVSNASVTGLLREGITRYALMGGTYYRSSVDEAPAIMMGTLRHGFSNLITGYAGFLGGQDYKSGAAGLSLNTPLGAISSDIIYAQTSLRNGVKKEGQRVLVSYAKILPVTNTNITLANYRYSSSGYYDIDDAMYLRSKNVDVDSWRYSSVNKKNRIQLSATQTLPEELGSISISASTQDYWDRSSHDNEYQLGYTKSFKRFSMGIYASKSRNLDDDAWDNRVSVTFSVPLGSDSQSPHLNTTYINERNNSAIQNSLAGTAGTYRQFSYSANTTTGKYSNGQTKTTGGLSGQWNSPWATMGGSFSAGSGYEQYGLTLSGGAVAYQNGVLLTPTMGETMAIIEADNAGGARISNNKILQLDNSGKAAVPYLTAYRKNNIGLDPKGLSNDVLLKTTSLNIVPTSGAVVILKYDTETGHSVLFNFPDSDGLEFGTSVTDENNNDVGYVGQGGQIFVRVKNTEGNLFIKREGDKHKLCQFHYRLPENDKKDTSLLQQAATCQP